MTQDIYSEGKAFRLVDRGPLQTRSGVIQDLSFNIYPHAIDHRIRVQLASFGLIELRLSIPNGIGYRVQRSDDLRGWVDASSDLQGSGGEEIWIDPDPGGLARFYRVAFGRSGLH